MYRYRSMTAYRSQSWMADGIGCRCGMGGIALHPEDQDLGDPRRMHHL